MVGKRSIGKNKRENILMYVDTLHITGLLSAQSCQVVHEYFKLLDFRDNEGLDDLQFLAFMESSTDLTEGSCLL